MANKELILLEDVDNLGKVGDEVTVASGYARNYLIPRRLAATKTAETMQRLEAKKRALQKEYEERLAIAQSMAQRIVEESVTIPMEATEEDKLYGSVTANHIAEGLKERGLEVEPHSINLEEPIRELGVYNVPVQLHPEVDATLKVWIVKK